MTTRTRPGTPPRQPTAVQLGIGMRVSLHPHADRFVEVILGALEDVRNAGLDEGLVTETDDVSTYVGVRADRAEQRLADYLTGLLSAAHRRSGEGHVVAHVLFSRGCPGEVSCDLGETGLPRPAAVDVATTGIAAAAQWSLYPLLDGVGGGSHMAHIESAIAEAVRRGVATAPAHYATRLSGDVAEVLATAVDAWASVGAVVPHVVSHLTISVGSPSAAPSAAPSGTGAVR